MFMNRCANVTARRIFNCIFVVEQGVVMFQDSDSSSFCEDLRVPFRCRCPAPIGRLFMTSLLRIGQARAWPA